MDEKTEAIIAKMDPTSQIHCAAAVDLYKEYEASKFYRNMKRKPDPRTETALAIMDIGKIYISRYILDKGPELTEHERKEIGRHGYYAYRYLKDEGMTDGIPEILLIHTGEENAHEIFAQQEPDDEFPEITDDIRDAARTVNTLDSYTGMIQRRPYRPPFTKEAALANLRKKDEDTVDADIIKYIDKKIREAQEMAY